MRGSEDRAALSCTVGIPLDSWYTFIIIQTVTLTRIIIDVALWEYLILTDADDNIGLTRNIIHDRTCHGNQFSIDNSTSMFAYMTLITATKDFTQRTAFDISIGLCNKLLCTSIVKHTTAIATTIEVLGNLTAMQTDVGSTADNSIATLTTTEGIAVFDHFLLTIRMLSICFIRDITHRGAFTDIHIGIGLRAKAVGLH